MPALIAVVIVALQWPLLLWIGVHLAPVPEALASGAAIFGAAFLLSWAAELGQLDVPRGVAIAGLAVIAVLPEYAVDLYLAWEAARDPAYVGYATANMTGANRLLIGVGWPVLAWIQWWRTRGARRHIALGAAHSTEMAHLLVATAYAFVIPMKGTLSLLDAAVLLAIFGSYVRSLLRHPVEPPHLVGPPNVIAALAPWLRRTITIAMFVCASGAILLAAEPFAESLVTIGRGFAVPEYLLIQWVAPLASEAPEFIVAVLFVLRGAASTGLGMLLSSKVNQWTLLVGALPIAYSLSAGTPAAMPLNGVQTREVLLTAAQSALAVVVLGSFTLSLGESAFLFGLFALQLGAQLLHEIAPSAFGDLPRVGDAIGYGFSVAYVVVAASWLAGSGPSRVGLLGLFRSSGDVSRTRRVPS